MSFREIIAVVPAYGGLAAAVATAVATYFLWKATRALVSETRRMVEAGSQPHVVATLEPNQWSMIHFDLNIGNTGNATAYDIQVSFDPPLENGEGRSGKDIPLQKISVLTPGNEISSYICEYKFLQGKIYKIQITWKKYHSSAEKERNTYEIDMSYIDGLSRLGSHNPLAQIAEQFKGFREEWQPIARKSRRISIETYTSGDRLHERRQHARWLRRVKHERQKQESALQEQSVSSSTLSDSDK